MYVVTPRLFDFSFKIKHHVPSGEYLTFVREIFGLAGPFRMIILSFTCLGHLRKPHSQQEHVEFPDFGVEEKAVISAIAGFFLRLEIGTFSSALAAKQVSGSAL